MSAGLQRSIQISSLFAICAILIMMGASKLLKPELTVTAVVGHGLLTTRLARPAIVIHALSSIFLGAIFWATREVVGIRQYVLIGATILLGTSGLYGLFVGLTSGWGLTCGCLVGVSSNTSIAFTEALTLLLLGLLLFVYRGWRLEASATSSEQVEHGWIRKSAQSVTVRLLSIGIDSILLIAFAFSLVVLTIRVDSTLDRASDLDRTVRPLDVGDPLPPLLIPRPEGSRLAVSEAPGDVALFFFGDCDACIQEIPFWNEIHNQLRERGSSSWVVGLYLSSKDRFEKLLGTSSRPAFSTRLLEPRRAHDTYGIMQLGQVYIIRQGMVLLTIEGSPLTTSQAGEIKDALEIPSQQDLPGRIPQESHGLPPI